VCHSDLFPENSVSSNCLFAPVLCETLFVAIKKYFLISVAIKFKMNLVLKVLRFIDIQIMFPFKARERLFQDTAIGNKPCDFREGNNIKQERENYVIYV
jgi:hypothetical protein